MVKKIIEKFEKLANVNGYILTENAEKIANAKLNFFGEAKWAKCPCDPESDRACISKKCKEDIERDGVCHCNLYIKPVNK